MAIECVQPADLDELHQALRQVPQRDGNVPDKPQWAVYRGCAVSSWGLQTSLMRLGGDLRRKESAILDEFRTSGRADLLTLAVDVASDLAVMTAAQHYGAPTRLLDWSKQADVAKHFATCSPQHGSTAGAIWVVNPHLVHEMLPPIIRNEVAADRPQDPPILKQNAFAKAYPDVENFDRHFNPPHNIPAVFFEGISTIPRVGNQAGLFSMVGDAAVSMLDVLQSIDGSCRKIVISPSMKTAVRAELDAQDTDERRLFPGLDGVGAFLSRYFREAAVGAGTPPDPPDESAA